MSATPILDDDKVPVSAGDSIMFRYGIPFVQVVAPIIERDGILIALTPDHSPRECELSKLRGYVGNWYKHETP